MTYFSIGSQLWNSLSPFGVSSCHKEPGVVDSPDDKPRAAFGIAWWCASMWAGSRWWEKPWQNHREHTRTTVTDRIIETTKNGKMPGFSPGNPQLIKKNKSEDYCCPGILSYPGKKVSIIKVSIILSVTAKREFSPFFAGIANYRTPAAVKRRAFHNDGIIMNLQRN